MRLLCAVENPTLSKMLDLMLAATGVDLDFVGDGRQAVRAARQTAFDALILDLNLPILNGIAVAQRIRELEHRHHYAPTPILFLSGRESPARLAEAMEVGTCACLSKPFTTHTLIEAIDEVMIKAHPIHLTGLNISALMRALH